METEYKNRGILHKVSNVTKLHKSSNTLVRRTTKTLLYGETALIFAKDIVTNRLVGKEFHIKFERKLNRSGKYRTHIRLIRYGKIILPFEDKFPTDTVMYSLITTKPEERNLLEQKRAKLQS